MKFAHLGKIQSFAVVGATGLVGQEFLELLSEHQIKIPRLRLFASVTGGDLDAFGDETTVEALGEDSFEDVEAAFFSVPTDVTRKYVPIAARAGCLIVDDSSVFRMESEVPLVVPEINGNLLRDFQGRIIATPNCSTTPVALCLKPLHDKYGIKRVVISTYQSVSGEGTAAYEELSSQTVALLNGQSIEAGMFSHQIAFNCLPKIGMVSQNGSTEEEERIERELAKILGIRQLKVSVTAVRVPTFCGHGASVNVEFENPMESIVGIRELLDGFPGLKVLDKPESEIYPTNIECIGSDYTLVGRLRRDRTVSSGVNFWVMTDNLRKGAALNALETLETLYNYRSMS